MKQLCAGAGLCLALLLSLCGTVSAAERVELHGRDQATTERLNRRGIVKETGRAAQGIGPVKTYLHSFRGEVLDLGADDSFHAVRERTDNARVKHTRYRQLSRNIPIFGKELILHEDQGGRVLDVNGSIVKGIEQDLPPGTELVAAYSAAEALEQAKKQISHAPPTRRHRQESPDAPLTTETRKPASTQFHFASEQSELNIYVDEHDKPRLVYYVNFFAEPADGGEPTRPHLLLDAVTGEVIKRWEGLTHQTIGTGPGGNGKVGEYEYGTNFGFLDVLQNGTLCTMQNGTVTTVDMTGMASSYATPFSYNCPRNTVRTINGAYSPLNDAHYFGSVIVNMYTTWYGIPPISLPLVMRPHYGTNYENAFWDGQYMTFGDGYSTFYPLVALDVAAHEVSHGFTEFNSNLIYDGESGGINESFSDMAGEASKFFLRGSNDWRVGADIKKGTGALRYMNNPPADGYSIADLSNYTNGLDVHYSSGLFNKAFYLLATKAGWTTKKAFDVMVKANMDYWTSASTFRSAACGAISAATDLGYSSTDTDSAFQGVNVYCGAPDITTTVVAPAIITGSASLTNVATPFSQTFSVSGGTPSYVWSKVSGTLPPGTTLNGATGEISGTPTTTGSYGFTLQVADALGRKNFIQWTITITSGLRAGWPKELALRPGSGWLSPSYSPVFADLNGDGKDEIIAVDGSTLYLLNETGVYKKVTLPGQLSAPAVADLNNDGQMEIVVTVSYGATAPIYAFHGDLTPVTGFPAGGYSGYTFVMGSPVIADLGTDGTKQIIAVGYPNMSTYPDVGRETIMMVDYQGHPVAGWPKPMSTDPNFPLYDKTVAVGNVAGDGNNRIVFASSDGKVHIFRQDGSELAQWPIASTVALSDSPVLADVDGDGKPEIILGYRIDSSTYGINVCDKDGVSLPGWPWVRSGWKATAPVVADLDGDRQPEIILGTSENVPGIGTVDRLVALRADGSDLPGWPVSLVTPNWFSYNSAIVVGDVNGDGHNELLINTMTPSSSCSGFCGTWDSSLNAYTFDGHAASGFPKSIPGNVELHSTPAIGDLDGNGRSDLALKSEDGMIYVWEADSAVSKAGEWPMYLHDPQHSGVWLPSSGALLPTASISGTPANPTNATGATLTIGGLGVVSYKFRLDAGSYSDETPVVIPISLTALSEAAHTVSVLGKDSTGNWQVSPTKVSWTVDTTPPTATVSGTPASPSRTGNATLTIGGAGVVFYKYQLDAGSYSAETAVATPISITGLSEASHTVTVLGKDAAGNWQITPTTVSWTVVLPPITTLTTSPASPDGTNGWFVTPPTVTLASNKPGTTYYQWGAAGAYSYSTLPQTWVPGGTAQNHRGDDLAKQYTLPFGFSFYGTTYTSVYVSTNGLMRFDATDTAYANSGSNLKTKAAIAPLWDDLRTDARTGDDVYIFQPDQDSVCFRWQAVTYSSLYDTNFEAILYRDGRIMFNYGTQTGGLTPTIGISKGDGTAYNVPYDNNLATTNSVASILYTPTGWNTYTTTLTPASGDNILNYYSVDAVGTAETVQSQHIKVDTNAPVSNASVGGGTYFGTQNVTLSCNDNGGSGCAATWYCLGSGCTPVTAYSSAIAIATSTDLRFYSRDVAGNNETVKTVTYTINVDALPPTTTATPGGGTYSAAQNVTLSCSDSGGSGCATTYYCIGTGCTPTTVYSSAVAVTTSTDLRFYSRDFSGNSEAVQTATYAINYALTVSETGTGTGTVTGTNISCTTGSTAGCSSTYASGTILTLTATPDSSSAFANWTGCATVSGNQCTVTMNSARSVTATFTLLPPVTTLTTTPASPDGTNGWFATIPAITLASNKPGTTYYAWGTAPVEGYSCATQPQAWIAGGTALNIRGLDVGNWYTLPFSFSFYDSMYTQVYLSTHGLIRFGATDVTYSNSAANLKTKTAIAPLWDDLRTDQRTGDDIYVFQPDQDSIGFRWQTVTTSGTYDTNVEAILYRDGRIRFNYGAQSGGLTPTIGISKGDGTAYNIPYDSNLTTTNNMASILCTPNSWNTYTTTLTPANGDNILNYYSVDSAGTAETVQSQHIKVDVVAPVSSAAPAGGTYSTPQNVTLSCNDNGGSGCAATYYCLGTGCTPTTLYGGPINIATTAVLSFSSTDNAGNAESVTTQSYSINIVPPTATISGTPASPTKATNATLVVGGTDVVAYRYKLDTGNYSAETPVTTPISLSSLGEATHTVSVIGKDSAGNWQVTPTSVSWTVDTTPPVATISGTPASPTTGTAATLTIGGADVVGYRYVLDGGSYSTELPFSTPITLSNLGEGTHTVSVIGRDAAGNWQTTATTVSWTVDRPVTIPGVGVFRGILESYSALPGDGILQIKGVSFAEDLVFNRDINITLSGGFDPATGTSTGFTVLSGSLTISAGSVIVDNLIIGTAN